LLPAAIMHAQALAAGLPRKDHVWITTQQLIRFQTRELDEMLYKLDSAKYERSFHPNLGRGTQERNQRKPTRKSALQRRDTGHPPRRRV
jgi:hypothetical protein